MRDDPSVIALVARVGDGDQEAWDEIIARYAPLVWSICLRYQLSRQDIDDVGQGVWLTLVENIGTLRQPAALPGWLATTTRNECLRVLRAARRYDPDGLPAEDLLPPDPDARPVDHELIVADLLSALMSDPPPGYAQVSKALGIPVGSIGPTRARCLERLRRSPHLAGFLTEETPDLTGRETGR